MAPTRQFPRALRTTSRRARCERVFGAIVDTTLERMAAKRAPYCRRQMWLRAFSVRNLEVATMRLLNVSARATEASPHRHGTRAVHVSETQDPTNGNLRAFAVSNFREAHEPSNRRGAQER